MQVYAINKPCSSAKTASRKTVNSYPHLEAISNNLIIIINNNNKKKKKKKNLFLIELYLQWQFNSTLQLMCLNIKISTNSNIIQIGYIK